MERFKVENLGLNDLDTLYPHSPVDYQASITEYLEAKFADGWDLAEFSMDGSAWFVFKPNGRNS